MPPQESLRPAEVEACLERVLESATFRTAERSRRLLRFIVDETLQGRADRLKDYTLGAEALGRGDDFDPRVDPVARVEASRLRSRLDVYYATEGADDEVRILLPKGGYVPRFIARATDPTPGAVNDTDLAPRRFPGSRATSWLRPMAWAVVGTLVAGGAWLVGRQSAATRAPILHLELTTPTTTDPASIAISPDGRRLAFVASDQGVPRLWVRDLSSAVPRPLAGTDHAALPFWSPDGHALGFFADSRVRRVDLGTGLVRTISSAPVPAGAAWSPEGVILHGLVPDSPLYRVSADGSGLEAATRLVPGQVGHRAPVFLPDGRRFLFQATGRPDVRGVFLGELGSTTARRLVAADAPALLAGPDVLLFVQRDTLVAQRFDPASATLLGAPVVVAEDVVAGPGAGPAAVSASTSGAIAYRTGTAGAVRRFVWFDRRGREVGYVGDLEARGPAYASLSPDGRRIAMQRTTDGNTDIWIVDVDRGTAVRFTSEPGPEIAPVWSPGGDRIAYAAAGDGTFQLVEKALQGADATLLVRTPQAKQASDWSPDGRHLLYRTVTTDPAVDMDVWTVPLDGDRTPVALVRTPFEERDAQFSPDGTWVAYQSNESGQYEVYMQPFGRSGERLRISSRGGVQARWRADGRELFYLTLNGELTAVPLAWSDGGRTVTPGSPAPLFTARVGSIQGISRHSYVVSADGERFLFDVLFERQPPPISIILNWAAPGRTGGG